MSETVILPYSPVWVTPQDLRALQENLTRRRRSIILRPYNKRVLPIWLADIIEPTTVTITMNNERRDVLFESVPGPQFFAPPKTKQQLFIDLLEGDIQTPRSTIFTDDLELDEAGFGPYLVIKTTVPGSCLATGIICCKIADFGSLRNTIKEIYHDDIMAGFSPIVQQYISTSSHPSHTCITTFLGKPIVSYETIAPRKFNPERIKGYARGEATSNSQPDRHRVLVWDDEMLEVAKQVARIMPETAVLSIDMVRCAETKRVYCVEVNQGNLAVLSAPILAKLRADLGAEEILSQFGGYNTMARRICYVFDQILLPSHHAIG